MLSNAQQKLLRGKVIKLRPLAVLLLTASCTSNLSKKDRSLLEADARNKQLELQYLHEIKVAQDNSDYDAYRYFLNEYFKVERLEIPPRLQSHPSYTTGGLNIKY